MKVAVFGCEAVGSLLLGYLSEKKTDLYGVVSDSQKDALNRHGLLIGGVRKSKICKVEVDSRLHYSVDIAFLTGRVDALDSVINNSFEYLKDSLIVITQNGVAAERVLRRYFSENAIASAIILFGASFDMPNLANHDYEGEIVVGNFFGVNLKKLEMLSNLLRNAFSLRIEKKMKAAKYMKLFADLTLSIPAVLGQSIQDSFSDPEVSRIGVFLNKEAYLVLSQTGIELGDLPNYSRERMLSLVEQKTSEAALVLSNIMKNLIPNPLYGSILQNIKLGRKSDIDFINGEIVRLAQEHQLLAPLNKKIVEMVHLVEASGKFVSKQEFFKVFSN
ncbi:MAG: ketopantoate reductase C-terminal domain-containing protein [Candidatus Omnitrophica bacterium]|nr:ketopantoate reductase C-terminal domain-containing protein [Candidatus Omnitrophota bacterium]